MGLLGWLFGRRRKVRSTDKIWLSRDAAWHGLCVELREHVARDRLVVVLAHFPASLAAARHEFESRGIDCETIAETISTLEFNRRADRAGGGIALLGRAAQLRSDPLDDRPGIQEPAVHFLLAERHLLPKYDDAVTAFAESLGRNCGVTYHLSLADPFLKHCAGEWVASVLKKLGMDESSPIESAIVARRMRAVALQHAEFVEKVRDAESAEEWMKSNGLGPTPS
jgi:hypothetical protein